MNPETEEYLNKVFMPLLDPKAVDDSDLPIWVRNIIKHFHGTGVKKLLEAIKNENFGPYEKGLFAGSLKHIEAIVETFIEVKEYNPQQIESAEISKQFDQIDEQLTELKNYIGEYEHDIAKGSNHDESEFLRGKSEGLQLIKDEDDQIKGALENTKLLVIIYACWPFIENNCKTRRQLYKDLLKMFWKPSEPDEKFNISMVEANPPAIIGNYERVEKILKRIRFKPAKVGRPRKRPG
tara:strand:- start:524 stop:1234 length:711 start_codon:yes stop_codon:yes gene_type:complete